MRRQRLLSRCATNAQRIEQLQRVASGVHVWEMVGTEDWAGTAIEMLAGVRVPDDHAAVIGHAASVARTRKEMCAVIDPPEPVAPLGLIGVEYFTHAGRDEIRAV